MGCAACTLPLVLKMQTAPPFLSLESAAAVLEDTMWKSLISAGLASAALIATPAMAGGNQAGQHPAQSVQIKFADLNLSTAEGQATLDRRINSAARKVCRLDEQRTGTRIPSHERKVCFAKAKASAKQQMASAINQTRRGG
jgi:UrcA family protein